MDLQNQPKVTLNYMSMLKGNLEPLPSDIKGRGLKRPSTAVTKARTKKKSSAKKKTKRKRQNFLIGTGLKQKPFLAAGFNTQKKQRPKSSSMLRSSPSRNTRKRFRPVSASLIQDIKNHEVRINLI